jgi:hypothetical protein
MKAFDAFPFRLHVKGRVSVRGQSGANMKNSETLEKACGTAEQRAMCNRIGRTPAVLAISPQV